MIVAIFGTFVLISAFTLFLSIRTTNRSRNRAAVIEVIDRLRLKLAGAHRGDHPKFTASFGLSDSTQSTKLEELILIADAGLYQSKNEGRDRITIGTAPISAAGLLGGTGDDAGLAPTPTSLVTSLLHADAADEDPRPTGAEIR